MYIPYLGEEWVFRQIQNTQDTRNTAFIVQYLFSFLIMALLRKYLKMYKHTQDERNLSTLWNPSPTHKTEKLSHHSTTEKRDEFSCFHILLNSSSLYNEEKHSSFKHAWNHRIVCIVYTWIAYMYPNHVMYSMSVWMSSVHVHFCAYCMCVIWCL